MSSAQNLILKQLIKTHHSGAKMIDSLLEDLTERGIQLWIENGQLQFKTSSGAMNKKLKQLLALHTPQLLLHKFYDELCLHQLFEQQV